MRFETRRFAGMSLAVVLTASAAMADTKSARTVALDKLRTESPGARTLQQNDRVTTVYGVPLARAESASASGELFRQSYAAVFDANAEDLKPGGVLANGQHVQPLMFDRTTGTYKFSLVTFSQNRDGVPVYQADLRLLVRNEPGFPVVLAESSLRDLGTLGANPAAPIDVAAARTRAVERIAGMNLTDFSAPKSIIWAGVDDQKVAPRRAIQFVGQNADPQQWRFLADAVTGEILLKENLMHKVELTGSVLGNATESTAADFCEEESLAPLPYARLQIGGDTVFADVNGDFVFDNAPAGTVTVSSSVRGQWFAVEDWPSENSTEIQTDVTAPGPVTFTHNANNDQFPRSEVNAYIHANVVRDFVLAHNPDYPQLDSTNFPVRVNRTDGFCPGNAWYTSADQSINFCRLAGGSPNTGYSSIVYHEYGHHLVNVAGSGQGQYGEGTGDVMALLITDEPELAFGFFGNCDTPLRNAINSQQAPCFGASHTCGQVLSGAVWDTRNELIVTEPDNYLDILSNLAVNAILLHTGSTISQNITVHYLTLDDDDGTLENGSPHYAEIATGFGMHNLDAPPLSPLAFVYPQGLPALSEPNSGAPIVVEIQDVAETLDTDNGPTLFTSIDNAAFEGTPLALVSGVMYSAALPSAPCFSTIEWYISAETISGTETTSPAGAPNDTEPFRAVVATGSDNVLSDDFEDNNPDYTVSGDIFNTDAGRWERGIPVGGGDRGDPPTDFDGSGTCWLTGNDDGNTDVDDGSTILTTAAFDMSDPSVLHFISYARWYSNTNGGSPGADIFVVEISNDDGQNWTNLETVGPEGAEADDGWFFVSHLVNVFVEPTATVRLRFIASDLGLGSVIEAGIDAISIDTLACEDSDTIPPSIVHDNNSTTRPFSGYIDPRVESTDGINVDLGVTEFAILFSEPVFGIGGDEVSPSDFTVSVTGGTAPQIASVSTDDNPLILLTLDGPIPLSQWTTIVANVEDAAGNAIESLGNLGPGNNEPDRIDIGFLPGDVDQSADVAPFDLLRFRMIVQDSFTPEQGTDEDFADMDRSGDIAPFDLLTFRQMINGVAPTTQAWSGQSLPDRP